MKQKNNDYRSQMSVQQHLNQQQKKKSGQDVQISFIIDKEKKITQNTSIESKHQVLQQSNHLVQLQKINKQKQLRVNVISKQQQAVQSHPQLQAIQTPSITQNRIDNLVNKTVVKAFSEQNPLLSIYLTSTLQRPELQCPDQLKYTAEGFYFFGQNYSSGKCAFLKLLLDAANFQSTIVKTSYLTFSHSFVEIKLEEQMYVLDPSLELIVGDDCMFKFFLVGKDELAGNERYQNVDLSRYATKKHLDFYTHYKCFASNISDLHNIIRNSVQLGQKTIKIKHSLIQSKEELLQIVQKSISQIIFEVGSFISIISYFIKDEFILLQIQIQIIQCLKFDTINQLTIVAEQENQFLIDKSNTNLEDIKTEIYHLCSQKDILPPQTIQYSDTESYIKFIIRFGKQVVFQNKLNLDLERQSYYDDQNPNAFVTNKIIKSCNSLQPSIVISPKEKVTQKQLNVIIEIIRQKYPELWFLELKTMEHQHNIFEITLFNMRPEIITLHKRLLQEISSLKLDKELPILTKQKNIIKILMKSQYTISSEDKFVQQHLFDVIGCLINKKCTCQGFAVAFSLLSFYTGIPVIQVVGLTKNNSQNPLHRWNMVKLNQTDWYHVDPTWIKTPQQLIYLNFDDNIRYNKLSLNQDLIPPVCSKMDLNYIVQNNQLHASIEDVRNYLHKWCLTKNKMFFYVKGAFNVDIGLEIQNLRQFMKKPIQLVSGVRSKIFEDLYTYEIEIKLEDIQFEEGYPEKINFETTYFVENDGTFDEKIQKVLKLGASSVSFTKDQQYIEFRLIKK